MKQQVIYIFTFFIVLNMYSQTSFHVFPKNHQKTPGTARGNGNVDNPWNLQTALQQSSDVVKSGDTIWLHEGTYNGRYVSTLESLEPGRYITVSGYEDDKVVLNGNVDSDKKYVLEVKGKQVIYKNFEITFLGEFSRNEKDSSFHAVSGLEHPSGEDCKFINLSVYNNPGYGIGSWKATGGTIMDGCIVYNNGFIAKNGLGHGEGIYTQNNSNKTRVIQNCMIFNNYYKGIEVWSANKNATSEYVKNYLIKNNVVFNNGNPAQLFKDNLIVGSGDRNGINVAKNVSIEDNVFYHNTDIKNAQINGDAAALTIGFNKHSPVENINISNNFIIGRNNALRILHAKSITFERNRIYTGYVVIDSSSLKHINQWRFNKNNYYTKKSSSFRVAGHKDYNLDRWQNNFTLDAESTWNSFKQFHIKSYSNIRKFEHRPSSYKVVLFDENENDVTVDFSEFNFESGTTYTIYDVENLDKTLKTGVLAEDDNISFPMKLLDFEQPLHNSKAQKSLSNFGVFIIKFESHKSIPVKEEVGFFKRFLEWLGF